jgi:Holliday junction resolvase RusA-like endonuclease
MHLVLTGQTPAQKNSKQMALNRATGKMFPVSNPIVKRWQKDVGLQLMQFRRYKFVEPVSIMYKFYVQDNRRRDIDNMIASINDALVKQEIIPDDSWQCLTISGAEAEIDKENPRAELWIDVIE